MGPPIQVFLTSIASAPALRQRQEQLLRVLQVKKIPFTSYDLAADEEAKKLWRRKAPSNNSTLPGILVGGELAGTYAEFEEAVEFGELDRFFRLNESWGEEDEAFAPTSVPQKPIAVPGVATPSQITGQSPSFAPSASKPLKKSTPRTKSIDVGSQLGFGLEGVKLTEEEMLELVESLGLDGDDAGELVKGLGLSSSKATSRKSTFDNPPAPSTSQTDTKTNASSESTETSTPTDTTTAPSDATKPNSKDRPSATGEFSAGRRSSSVPENKDTATKTAPDSLASTTALEVNETASKDVPTDEWSHKVNIPGTSPAVAVPSDAVTIEACHVSKSCEAPCEATSIAQPVLDLHRNNIGPLFFLAQSSLVFRSSCFLDIFDSHLYLSKSSLINMSPYYTGPVPTAPRFWDMKAATAASDSSLDRVCDSWHGTDRVLTGPKAYHVPGHFDMRSSKRDSPEIVSSPEASQYFTPTMHQDGFKSSPPSSVYCTPESIQSSPERRVAMYRQTNPESPSASPSPSPTESMFSRLSRPESATSFVESVDDFHGNKRSPQRQRSIIPSLVVTDYDSDEEHEPKVDASPIRETFIMPAHQRSTDLRVDAVTFRPNPARDHRQITTVPSPSINGGATPVVRPQARVVPQYPLPPRSYPYPTQSMPQPPRPVLPATVAPRYKQVPAFQVVPRRFPTPKPILAMRMAGAPQSVMQPVQAAQPLQYAAQPRVAKNQTQPQQHSTLYDSRGQTFEGKPVRPVQQRVSAMPLSSVRHLWPATGVSLPNAEANSSVWHPSFQEAQSIISIQQARILKGLSNGVPYGGGLYLPIPFDENLP
ncbi:SH3-binding, glutamic acid-rich protein [Rhizoctonia solani]|uniref:SH3-binding, glutamic acid-rich protein n=1 Tax=Rhizoctonia solani TaxID=456999 RepID=A0A8H7IPC0_9AGAM|nr:SH3-binding, glutamic acid-rich protein [Rhizoctonia solani]